MGVAGTNCRFVHVDIGSYGKECDSTVFLQIYAIDINSDKYAGIIQWETLSGTEGPNVLHFFVGDEGFALNRNIVNLMRTGPCIILIFEWRLTS